MDPTAIDHFPSEEFACHDGTPYPSEWVDDRLAQLKSTLEIIRAGISLNSTGFTVGEHATALFNSGRHYGSGNSGTAAVWSIGVGSWMAYPNTLPPTMDAGSGVIINGGSVPIGSLPVNLSLTTGSAVYAT